MIGQSSLGVERLRLDVAVVAIDFMRLAARLLLLTPQPHWSFQPPAADETAVQRLGRYSCRLGLTLLSGKL